VRAAAYEASLGTDKGRDEREGNGALVHQVIS